MHADYVSYYTSNPTMLILQHNNLTQAQLLKIRANLKSVGAKLRVIRVGIFEHAVRVASFTQSQELTPEQREWEVNSKAMSRYVKRNEIMKGLDLTQLLSGPVCAITFPTESIPHSANDSHATTTNTGLQQEGEASKSLSPEHLKKTIRVISESQGRLLLLGGKFDGQVFTVDSLDRISSLPDLVTLRGQLLSLLGAPAMRLSQILGTPAQQLTRTFEGRKLALEGEIQETK